jgi:hypothetical protein
MILEKGRGGGRAVIWVVRESAVETEREVGAAWGWRGGAKEDVCVRVVRRRRARWWRMVMMD